MSPPGMQVKWIAAVTIAMTVALATSRSGRAAAVAEEEARWMGALTERVVKDLAEGRPLVAQVHAPLCERTIIPCGNQRLGDGDSLATNLYWATTAGFGKWFGRRGGGWKKVLERRGEETGDRDLLSLAVYRRTMEAPRRWRELGAPKRFEVYVVISGWRGTAIDRALGGYARELAGQDERVLEVEGRGVRAGGAAHLVAYSGHNRLMDLSGAYAWPAPAERAPIGMIALACHTASYMETQVSGPTRVPLLMTRDFLFANAAPVEGVILAFAQGRGYQPIRVAAAQAYAEVQKRDLKRVIGAFTNPADARWGKPAKRR